MSRAQAESVIKNIIREIAQQCCRQGQAVSETLTAFMVKAVVLDPRNLFNVDRTLTKQDVEKLIELCVNRLLDQKSPALDTIKMQVHFDMNYTSRREFVEEHQKVVQMRLLPVCREITDSRAKSRDELDDLYRRMVTYVLLRSGLGSASDVTNVQEATAALQSVFPQSELAAFMSLLRRDKEQQLNELTMIITGIRLFNKDSGKGGESVEDLPAVLNEALPAASADIERELEGTQRFAWRYTALLERRSAPDTDGELNMDLLTQALYNLRQHEAFLKIILADVITCAKQVEALQTDFISRMRVLKATVHAKTAVPTSQVFPHFTALARLWVGLQDEMLLLNMLRSVALSLRPFLSAQSQLLESIQLDQLLQGETVKSDAERAAESSEERVDPAEMKSYEWILPETTANFEQLPLQYRGVCGYTLVEKNGLLLPGNPNIGILKHREKYYSFSSKQAAYQFASNADKYIELIAERAKRSPELIQLLELHQQFASVTPYSQMQSGERLLVKPISKSESSTQTDTHLLESNIVKSYEWNEWELRRKAIKLANLRSKVTRSMQTDLSHMRRHNNTQTYTPKDAACQTKRDSQSNVPKPQIYLAGLRGGGSPTTHMTKIDLTRAVHE
ncbi:cilia- and flagella-associated protein 206 [Pangasianodon hypophthalmus]|uniref:cilia- and flagella-associated protein 206 n=1 Tax=Pangasianodon hypophthalmus TaxID=310915 RepID=UPI002307D762|nr:cilia- and flagella-associated protein 206 [Pangasianodon hypophthalmus]